MIHDAEPGTYKVLMDDYSPYAMSFDATNAVDSIESIDFFHRYGYVVYRNVYNRNECQQTRDAMWTIVEDASDGVLKRNDPLTWNLYKSAGKYGLSSRGPCFHQQLVNNRQNPMLAMILSKLIDTPIDDVMVSHDRYTIYRPTIIDPSTTNGVAVDGSLFSTGKKNVHLDMNPWWWSESSDDILTGVETLKYDDPQDLIKENNMVVKSMGMHVQCVLNFNDNRIDDGGTLVLPGFHHHILKWNEANKHLRKPLPWLTFSKDVDEQPLLQNACRVPMREGSVLIWNQTLIHGTSPNNSSNCRMAQFMKAFSRSQSFKTVTSSATTTIAVDSDTDTSDSNDIKERGGNAVYTTDRLIRRASLLKKCMTANGSVDAITPLGSKLFGLDVL